MVEETGVPDENHHLTKVTGHFLTCPGQDSNTGIAEGQLAFSDNALDHKAIRGQALSSERQLAVSSNTLDHMAIRAGP